MSQTQTKTKKRKSNQQTNRTQTNTTYILHISKVTTHPPAIIPIMPPKSNAIDADLHASSAFIVEKIATLPAVSLSV